MATVYEQEFRIGDYIYYWDGEDTWPGRVVAVRKRVRVLIDHWCGDRFLWTTPTRLTLQEGDDHGAGA